MAGLLSPLAPGLSGAINPLAFIGAGMASGNPAQALQQMGDLQLAAQQLRANQMMNQRKMAIMQAEADRERKQFEAQQKAALAWRQPLLNMLAPNATEQQMNAMSNALALTAQGRPSAVLDMTKMLEPPTPSNAMRIYSEAGGQTGTGKPFPQWYSEDYKGAGTTVQVGGPGEFGAVPSGKVRIEDPQSPTGSRLVDEPGSPTLEKRETAQQKLIAPLDSLEDSLERYRRVLREVGPEMMTGPGKLRLQAAYKDLLIKQKEADELGALTGPDLELVQSGLIDPTGWTAQLYEKTGQAKALEAQLDEAKRGINDARARARGEQPERPKGTLDNPEPIAGQEEFEKLPSGSYYVGPDGVTRQKP